MQKTNQQFQSIALNQLNQVKHTNRIDCKYRFKSDDLPLVLEVAKSDYNPLVNRVNRLTLVNKDLTERCTIDRLLHLLREKNKFYYRIQPLLG